MSDDEKTTVDPVEGAPRLWRKGDGIWVVAGERRGHAGEVLRDQQAGETEVWVAVRGGTDKDPQDVTGQWSVTALQPYRWIDAADRERLHNLIRELYPKGTRTTVRAWELADFLMMHGLVFEGGGDRRG